MTEPRKPGVYICYRHCEPDETIARALHELLSRLGFAPFLDRHDECLEGATVRNDPLEIANCIERGLDDSDALVGILTGFAFESPWMPYEIGSARGRSRFAEGESAPPPGLKHPGDTVRIAHLLCTESELQLPAFLRLSTLVADTSELEIWLEALCRACGTERIGSVADALADPDFSILDGVLPRKRTKPVVFDTVSNDPALPNVD